jgi:hypothetical protein
MLFGIIKNIFSLWLTVMALHSLKKLELASRITFIDHVMPETYSSSGLGVSKKEVL